MKKIINERFISEDKRKKSGEITDRKRRQARRKWRKSYENGKKKNIMIKKEENYERMKKIRNYKYSICEDKTRNKEKENNTHSRERSKIRGFNRKKRRQRKRNKTKQ